MGQPAYSTQPPTAVSPDSLSGVIAQTQNNLSEVESRIGNLLRRIEPSPRNVDTLGKTAQVEPSGILNAASTMRNTANRLIDLVSQLENAI